MKQAWLALVPCMAVALGGFVPPAAAQVQFRQNDRPVTIWVTIVSAPGEGVWQACRRVYQRDVYKVRRKSATRVRCEIDHSRLYDPGSVRQNFNTR